MRDEVVMKIAKGRARGAADGGAAVAFDIGVDEPEQAVGVGEARRPDAAGIGIAEHVELARADEWAGEQAPVHEVARVMNLHAGEPLEGGGRDVIVFADAHDGRVGIETGQDRIADHGAEKSGVGRSGGKGRAAGGEGLFDFVDLGLAQRINPQCDGLQHGEAGREEREREGDAEDGRGRLRDVGEVAVLVENPR